MEMTKGLRRIMSLIMIYQEEHKIEKCCFINSFVAALWARHLGYPTANVKAVIGICLDGELNWAIHMVTQLTPLEQRKGIIEASLEFNTRKMEYYDNWAVFEKVTNITKVRCFEAGKDLTKKMLSMFLQYKKEADVLNEMLQLDTLAIPIMLTEMSKTDHLRAYLQKLAYWIKFVVDNPEQFKSEQDVRQMAREM